MRVIKDKYWWQARRREEKDFAEVQEKVNKPLFDEGGNALKFSEEESGLRLGDVDSDKMVASEKDSVANAAEVRGSLVAGTTTTVANSHVVVADPALPVANGSVQVADISKVVALAIEFATEKLQSTKSELQNGNGCKESSELHSKQSEVAELKTELQKHKDMVASLSGSVAKLEADACSKDQVTALEEKVSKVLDLPNKNELLSELNKQRALSERLERVAIMFEDESNEKSGRIQQLETKLAEMAQQVESLSKPATPTLPMNQTEQQASVSGIANANSGNLANGLENNQALDKATLIAHGSIGSKEQESIKLNSVNATSEISIKSNKGRKPLSTFVFSAGIMIFLIFNTYFLVSEQYSLNVSLGYSAAMAWLIAVLTESGLVMLSMAGSWAPTFSWKMCLYGACAVMTWVTVGIIDSSVDNRVEHSAATSDKINRLRDRLTSLQAQEHTAQDVIDQLDPEVYPTKITTLRKELETGPSAKIEVINAELDQLTSNHSSAKSDPLIQQRRVMLLCNLLLAAFLGFLWSGRNSCWITKCSQKVKPYFFKLCDAL